ncbi:MAG: TolC family protein [Chitinophagales bacterium]|nr:TolC family protein [Chitinophagales bacterium]
MDITLHLGFWSKSACIKSIIIYISFCSFSLNAQKSITSTDILTAYIQNASKLPNEALSYMQNSPQKMPLSEKLEFRTESNQLDWQQQEYLLRWSLNGGKARQAHQELVQNQMQILKVEDNARVQDKLMQQYHFIIDWYILNKQDSLLEQKRIILEDKKKVYEQAMALHTDFNIDDWLRNDQRLQSMKQKKQEFLSKQRWILENMPLTKNSEIEYTLSGQDWISIQTLQEIVKDVHFDGSKNPEYIMQEAKTAFAKAELELEKAKGQKIIDYIQIKYRGDDNNFKEEWSAGLGFNIPTKSSSRLKRNKAMLELLEEKKEQQWLEEDLAEKIRAVYFSFQHQLEQYIMLEASIQDDQIEKTLMQHISNPDIEILTLLKIKENKLSKQEDLLTLEAVLLYSYISLLELTGKLAQTPTVNFLSNSLEPTSN